MAEETTSTVVDDSSATEETPVENGTSIVTDEGLLNESAFADETLQAAAKSANEVLKSRLAERDEALAAAEKDAEQFRRLANDPQMVKYLYDQHFKSTTTQNTRPEPEDTEFDIADDLPVDGATIKKLVKYMADSQGKSLKRVKDELLAEVSKTVEPTAKRVQAREQQARWDALVKQYPDAATPEYRKAISKVLGTRRVAPDDYEAAYILAERGIKARKAAEDKAVQDAKKTKAAAKAASSKPESKRVDASNLQQKGGGWLAAVAAAKAKKG